MFVAGDDTQCAIVADWRLRTDSELDESEPERAHVLEFYSFGRWCLGKHWRDCSKLALFGHGDRPTARAAAAERERLVGWLEHHRPRRLYVIPTPDSTLGAEATALKGTHCWQALHAPDTLEAMRGTRWAYNEHTEVTALFPIAKRVKELQRWLMATWLRARSMPTLRIDERLRSITPGEVMLDLMEAMRHRPLAVDLEFNPSTDIVTAVGLSDGQRAVSIPWDRYRPRNNEEEERGIAEFGPVGRRIVSVLGGLLADHTTKVAHNFVADIPRLKKRGFVVNGKLHDTFAAHAIAFPELRHGLQHAAASLLPVPPWKSLYKPSRLARGISRDDEEFWIADPKALRTYNTEDAFYTWHLAQAVLPHVGAHL